MDQQLKKPVPFQYVIAVRNSQGWNKGVCVWCGEFGHPMYKCPRNYELCGPRDGHSAELGYGFTEAWFVGDYKNGNEALRFLWWHAENR